MKENDPSERSSNDPQRGKKEDGRRLVLIRQVMMKVKASMPIISWRMHQCGFA